MKGLQLFLINVSFTVSIFNNKRKVICEIQQSTPSEIWWRTRIREICKENEAATVERHIDS